MKKRTLEMPLLIIAICLSTGCAYVLRRPAPSYDSFEKETAGKTNDLKGQLAELEVRLISVESSLNTMRRQIEELMQPGLLKMEPSAPASQGDERQVPVVTDEVPEFVVEKVNIGLFSVPFDKDKDGIDDGLSVYVCPTDREGDTIKRVGMVKLDLIDLSSDQPTCLMHWEFPPQETVKHWEWLLRGYGFKLFWQGGKPPVSEEVYLKVTFIDKSGKVFFDDRKFHLKLGQTEG